MGDDQLIGQTVTEVREMTDEEFDDQLWHQTVGGGPRVIVLENGTVLFPSCDPEGNGPGALIAAGNHSVEDLVGATLVDIAPMSEAATESRNWTLHSNHGQPAPVLGFEVPDERDEDSRKTQVYIARDHEQNGPGMLFYTAPDGETYANYFEFEDNEDAPTLDAQR